MASQSEKNTPRWIHFLVLKKCFLWRMKSHETFLKQASLTESFSDRFCSLVCQWTACMTMASHLLSRFTIINCMDWWSAFRLQVSWSSRRCWHNRSTEATPRRLCLISEHRDWRIDKQQMSAWNTSQTETLIIIWYLVVPNLCLSVFFFRSSINSCTCVKA